MSKNDWWFGFFACVSVNGLIQDWIGKEAYIARVSDGWVDLPWWIWIPLIVVCFVAPAWRNGQ